MTDTVEPGAHNVPQVFQANGVLGDFEVQLLAGRDVVTAQSVASSLNSRVFSGLASGFYTFSIRASNSIGIAEAASNPVFIATTTTSAPQTTRNESSLGNQGEPEVAASALSGGAVAGVLIAALALLLIIIFLVLQRRKSALHTMDQPKMKTPDFWLPAEAAVEMRPDQGPTRAPKMRGMLASTTGQLYGARAASRGHTPIDLDSYSLVHVSDAASVATGCLARRVTDCRHEPLLYDALSR